MGTLTPDEEQMYEMYPTWLALDAVAAFRDQQMKFIREELPADARFDAAGMTVATALAKEFANDIWPHRVPTRRELVTAKEAGRLEAKIDSLNREFARSCAGLGRRGA